MLPHQRMLNSMEKQEVDMLLSLKANKKMVKEKMNDLCLPSSQTSSAISVLSPHNYFSVTSCFFIIVRYSL